MDITLVVMAAGMGSRFGGLKQAEPITADGKCILDFSVYDALKAGFNKVVFIIRRDIEEDFKKFVGNRIALHADAEYVFQETSNLPQGRTKPFGTAHAILCCKDVVKGPFAVINADDYYGRHAFDEIYTHLLSAQEGQYAMVAYQMGNTVSDNGGVTRGVCAIQNGKLTKIAETGGITADCVSQNTGERFLPTTPVSMNLWGLTCDIFPYLEVKYAQFLFSANLQKDEFLIPTVIFEAISENVATVTAYRNSDKWYGITYRDDLAKVKSAINGYLEQGIYRGIW